MNASALTPEQGGAITGGGKALTGVKSEQIKEIRPDYVQTIEISDRDKDFSRGYQVKRKSDPDGVYVYNLTDRVIYSVSRYIYLDELELWVVDDSFSYVHYNKEEFEAEYDLVYGMAPTKIDYMSEYLYNRRGTEGVQLLRDDEPDAVYIGVPTNAVWDWDDDYSGNYEIHRVTWDDDQEIYVEDTSFEEIDLMAAELEENGYQIAKETHSEHKKISVWDSEPSAYNRYQISGDIMIREDDPDGLYVCIGKYTSEVDGIVVERGITVHKVHYDADAEEYYIKRSYVEPECFYITDEVFDSGESGFSYDYDTVSTIIHIRYLPEDYDIQSDMSGNMIQLKKNGEPGAVYGYRTWTHYFEDDTEREEYGLYRLQFNEKLGVYVEDSDFDYVEFYDLSYLDENGYEVVQSEQPLEYYSKGRVYRNEYPIYHDNDGNTYFADYYNNIYSYSEADAVTIGETTYYVGTYQEDLGIGDLKSTEHEVVTDKYKYWIDGPEYHHAAGGSGSFTLSGAITSYLSDDNVTVTLIGANNNFISSTTGKTNYLFPLVPAGAYKLSVSKKDHVTREYNVNVSGDTTQDVKICPLGDASMNGRVQANDAQLAYQQSQGKANLSDYAILCADVAPIGKPNGKVQAADAMIIYQQAQGKHVLY